mmetsp:Transcript_34899/g.87401  ORF Transcript_34899/g.87401 Transcript_34899/m.87401 type:complete len:364 (-) Transcript_34899:249-1340(-)
MAGDARSLQRSRAPDTDSASLSLEDVELGGMDMKREATYASPDESQRRHAEETAGGGRGIKRTGQIVKPPTRLHVALRKVDNYAVKPTPAKLAGGIITVIIWLATLAYIAWTLYQWFSRPVEINNTIDWMVGNGPFPLPITCKARTGCYFSNRYRSAPQMTGGQEANAYQQDCIFLAYNQNITADVLFSMDTNDGVAVLFDNNQTDLPNIGVFTTSTVQCTFRPNTSCLDGIQLRDSPVGKGNILSNMVAINNLTVSDAGRERREWFNMPIDPKSDTPDPAVSACVDTVASLPNAANYVQTRFMPNVNFVTSEISRADNWSDLFGIFGGAYEMFLAIGALILVTSFREGGFNVCAIFAASAEV